MEDLLEIECSIDFQAIMDGTDGELTIGEETYRLTRLDRNIRGNKGGNSWVMKMYNCLDEESMEDDNPVGVIKINKSNYFASSGKYDRKNNKRINQEIMALKDCKEQSAEYVITIDKEGLLKNTIPSKQTQTYRFYTMEAAKCDLKKYMEHYDGEYLGRIEICMELTKSLKELYGLGYYHRDIKPDNFFFLKTGEWKVGDLGLVDLRNKPSGNDAPNEFIGPKGWTSPEAMNKYLINQDDKRFDRFIDEKSDMFQLGMVFWYIFQGNAPIGNIMEKDFQYDEHDLYILIRTMVSYNKATRPKDFDDILNRLNYIASKAY